MKKKIGIVFLCVCMFLSACKTEEKKERYQAQFLTLFDTMTEIVGYAKSEEIFKESIQKIHDELLVYHEQYDIYNNYDGINNIKTINDNAGIKPVVVDQKIIDLLLLGKEMYQQTNGEVNIAYGSVLTIWHNNRTKGLDDPKHATLPTMEELVEAEQYTDINQLLIDEKESTVFLADKRMNLDVGSLGKGYAVERVTDYAKELGITDLLLSVGGNISAIGTKIDGTKWKLGIQNPDKNSEEPYVMKVYLENQSLVTSGNYQRYYVVDGKSYHHIIDPDTKMPSDYFAAVSVISRHSGIADALSTAVYNMPYEEGRALIEHMEETEALWVMKDGSLFYTDGFAQTIAK